MTTPVPPYKILDTRDGLPSYGGSMRNVTNDPAPRSDFGDRRVQACMKACEGIPTSALESNVIVRLARGVHSPQGSAGDRNPRGDGAAEAAAREEVAAPGDFRGPGDRDLTAQSGSVSPSRRRGTSSSMIAITSGSSRWMHAATSADQDAFLELLRRHTLAGPDASCDASVQKIRCALTRRICHAQLPGLLSN